MLATPRAKVPSSSPHISSFLPPPPLDIAHPLATRLPSVPGQPNSAPEFPRMHARTPLPSAAPPPFSPGHLPGHPHPHNLFTTGRRRGWPGAALPLGMEWRERLHCGGRGCRFRKPGSMCRYRVMSTRTAPSCPPPPPTPSSFLEENDEGIAERDHRAARAPASKAGTDAGRRVTASARHLFSNRLEGSVLGRRGKGELGLFPRCG